ncbi:LacI family DNA-binding transcriptional regulator [Pseudoduganella eburnea]|uniref:LacI family DNA-binding transcriptional regulator n=1 Tax=Massilia eburnea TaxID=1776165 RepID=A0A6L6QNM0_9BURK|nr:transposase [Massilia eburnea]MTW13785.1 LacI family DNA-binding transcriptional regulator [Massilia eburnea]
MNRPLRIELDNSLYHITARGDRQDKIFRSDNDRLTWLSLLGETCERFNFSVRSYCQMTNHFHILLETANGELGRGMCHLNGKYSRYFNRTHGLVGHVFQGRYKAILCQTELYQHELSRYIELNPVRAKIVAHPVDWPWSSYAAKMGLVDSPIWLRSDEILAQFGGDRSSAMDAYQQFVLAGLGGKSPLANVSNHLILGDEIFQASIIGQPIDGNPLEVVRAQRRAVARPLKDYFSEYRNPKEAMARAYSSLAYSMPEIAQHAGVSVKTVSRAIAQFESLKKVH